MDANKRTAPIQNGGGIRLPWWLHEEAWLAYAKRGVSQSAEDIARRGGFGVEELDEYVPDWRDRRLMLDNVRRDGARDHNDLVIAYIEALLDGMPPNAAEVTTGPAALTVLLCRLRDGSIPAMAEALRARPSFVHTSPEDEAATTAAALRERCVHDYIDTLRAELPERREFVIGGASKLAGGIEALKLLQKRLHEKAHKP